MAVMYVANHLNVRAIIALTESGSTPLWMSRVRSDIPVFAFTRHEATSRRVSMYRGVYAVPFDIADTEAQTVDKVFETLLHDGAVAAGDLVLFTKGDQQGVSGQDQYDADPHCAGRGPRPPRRVPDKTRKALVLPGAGARGAYQVGVLKAVASLLPKNAPNPFAVITGASAGAINAAVLAGRAGKLRARDPRHGARLGELPRAPGLPRRQLDDGEVEPALARGARVRRPRCSQPGLTARQHAAARVAEARRALRRHRPRDRARPPRGARDHRVGLQLGALGDVVPRSPESAAVDACAPRRPGRANRHRSLDGERGSAVRVSARQDRRRVLRRRLDAPPRAAIAGDPSRRRPHARDRCARRATGSGAASQHGSLAADFRAARRLHARHAVHGRPVHRSRARVERE